MASRSVEGSAGQALDRGPSSGSSALLAALLASVDFVACAWLVANDVISPAQAGLASLAVAAVATLAVQARRQRAALDHMKAAIAQRDDVARALRLERDHAAGSSASKTRFFAAASHDLRQPLHALSINATTLQLVAGRIGDPVIRDLSDSINNALMRSNGLLDSLLDLSRLDAHAVELKLVQIDLVALLEAAGEQYKHEAVERGLSLRLDVADDYPRTLRVVGDAPLLFRVVGNLLSNALKFTASGGIVIGVAYVEGRAVMSVQDTGRGIAPHELPHVFEEFYQVGSPPRSAESGLGLGLAIVRRAVDLIKMTIDIESTVGAGTTVSLSMMADESNGTRAVGRGTDPVSMPGDDHGKDDARPASSRAHHSVRS